MRHCGGERGEIIMEKHHTILESIHDIYHASRYFT